MRHLLFLAPLTLLAGCGLTLDAVIDPDASAPDAAILDAGIGDAGNADAGEEDAGQEDAGPGMDSGPGDSGVLPDAAMPTDAGHTDAGSEDAAAADAGGCDPVDRDGDGFSECEGDCDTTSGAIHPGRPEACDDEVDNDCDTSIDEVDCLGTHVAMDGTDSASGSQSAPLRRVSDAVTNAKAIGEGTPVYIAAGSYTESVRLEESHSVLCGHDRTTWVRNPVLHVTTLTAADPVGHRFAAGTLPTTELSGCTLVGAPDDTLTITVAFARGAAGILTNNTIRAADAVGGTSVAVAVHPEALLDSGSLNGAVRPVIDNNDVELGDSLSDGSPAGPTFDQGSFGIVVFRSDALVQGNRVLMNPDEARRVSGIVFWQTPPGTLAFDNTVSGSQLARNGAGIFVFSGAGSIFRNRVFPPPSTEDNFGMLIAGDARSLRVANNVFYGGASSSGVSGGLLFRTRAVMSGTNVMVHSNYLSGGADGRPTVGVGWQTSETGTTPVTVGIVRSNILVAGGGSDRHAAWEGALLYRPSAFDHNALSGAGTAALYSRFGAVVLNAGALNALSTAFSGNLYADCGLESPGYFGDHHLTSGSVCINAGNGLAGEPQDFEGDPRPGPDLLYDIGPDEYLP
ncbi:MAG: MopE-related protein [Sandaracinaceae bacterium]